LIAPVRGLLESSLIEWEGRISAVFFLPTCNFRCPNCHAPHLLAPVAEDDHIPLEPVRKLLKSREGWIDGVVISGGEPTVHGEALIALCREIKGWGLEVRLSTNGSRPETLGRLLAEDLIASVAMDVKHRLRAYEYSLAAGVAADMEAVQSGIEMLKSSCIEVEFRTTVVPGLHDPEDIESIAKTLGPKADYVLQAFRPGNCLSAEMNKRAATLPETLQAMAERANAHVARCRVRGVAGCACREFK